MERLSIGGSLVGGPGRGTTQRTAVLEALRSTDRFRTAQDLYSVLRADGARIGLTTVYRHLQKLADDGVIHSVQTTDRQTAYRLCSDTAHHHLVCKVCGAAIEIADKQLDSRISAEATRRGFADISHRLEVFGVCPECASADGTKLQRRA
jgi:Fur family ferric uptake transcriptional regulator